MITDEAEIAEYATRQGQTRTRPVSWALTAAALLGGCSSLPASVNPVEWWHGLQGGAIAEQRPPPPGATDPYPNLATVPGKPAPTSAEARKQIADALIADRTHAQHEAALAPLPDPSSPTASPALFGQGSAPPPGPASRSEPQDSAQASASLAAATPPPQPPPQTVAPAAASPVSAGAPAPAPAPVGSVQTAPLGPAPGTDTARPPATETSALPPLPATPPPAPAISGVPTASPETPPRVASAAPPPQAAPPPPAVPAAPVPVAFAPGSAQLPAGEVATLRTLAARRGAGSITVTGYGEARSFDPEAQSSALSLGLSRAQAMASALMAAGVPALSVQIDAEAAGRGGTARLVN